MVHTGRQLTHPMPSGHRMTGGWEGVSAGESWFGFSRKQTPRWELEGEWGEVGGEAVHTGRLVERAAPRGDQGPLH